MSNIAFRGFDSKRRFGVELEVSNTVPKSFLQDVIQCYTKKEIKSASWAQSKNNDYWHIKTDATCGILGKYYDKGWEIASYVGSGDADIQHIAEVAGGLKQAGVEVNDNCGLHVHVEVKDFDQTQMGVLIAHYLKWEWMLLNMVPERRQKNYFCRPLLREFIRKGRLWVSLVTGFTASEERQYVCVPAEKISPLTIWGFYCPHNLEPHENPCRYRSVNLVNYATSLVNPIYNRRTVEFRLPEGTLSKTDVANWIRLFVNFVDWCAASERVAIPLDICDMNESLWHMGLGHNDETFYIFDKTLFDLKTWVLKRYIKHGYCEARAKEILNEMWNPEKEFH